MGLGRRKLHLGVCSDSVRHFGAKGWDSRNFVYTLAYCYWIDLGHLGSVVDVETVT